MAVILKKDKGSALTHAEMDTNFEELRDIPNGKVFPKQAGGGIKLDTLNPTHGWHDLTGQLAVYGDPTDAIRNVYNGGIKSLQFDVSDSAYVDFHMPHDYVPGSDIFIHVHWSHNSSVVTGGSCTWVFELMYAKGYEQAQFNIPVLISVVQTAEITSKTHQIAETIASTSGGSSVLLNTDLLEVDGIFQCRVYLDSNDITTSNASVVAPFAHFVDIHYQSSGVATKGRNFPFYT